MLTSAACNPYQLWELSRGAEHRLSCRSPTADVVLDHPSLSRQHAAVCYNRLSREWVVLDLDSAHGTKADGRPAPKVSISQHQWSCCGDVVAMIDSISHHCTLESLLCKPLHTC